MDKITRALVWIIFIVILLNTQFTTWKLNAIRDHLCANAETLTRLCLNK